ncbi:MAG: threonine/serine dehydratase, partial [Proteobacteria bacterium]|nr:threonine/serine dehydratase [Pseudomonadota bacterium]
MVNNKASEVHHNLNKDRVEAAYRIIQDYVTPTPLKYSEYFSEKHNIPVYLKLENLNISGSFKIRGAAHALLRCHKKELARGVMATSAGNHAQGVAHMAKCLGVKAKIFMPQSTSLIKVTSTENYGAEVSLVGDSYMEAESEAMKWLEQNGAKLIHAYRQEDVILGQGTVAIEVMAQCPEVGVVVAPIGGGGLITGMAAYLRGYDTPERRVKLFGVQSRLCCPVSKLFHGHGSCGLQDCDSQQKPIKAFATLADGIAVKNPSPKNIASIVSWVDGVQCVGERDLAGAIMELLEREHILGEGAGVASLAALELYHNQIREMADGRPVVCVISGGNIDASVLCRIMQKG